MPTDRRPRFQRTASVHRSSIRNSFLVTVDLLQYIADKSQGKILCAPHTKVVDEDAHLVGVLTQTNQFISVKPEGYIPNPNDGLRVLNGSNYLLRDTELQTHPSKVPISSGAFVIALRKLRSSTDMMGNYLLPVMMSKLEKVQAVLIYR